MEDVKRKTNPVKERVKAFVAYLGISEREFCRRLGVSNAYIESIKQGISQKIMQTISIQYPQLNPIWLLMGTGEMILEGAPEGSAPVPVSPDPVPASPAPSETLQKLLEVATEEKARLLSLVESQQRTIEMLADELKKANARTGEAATCAAVV